MLAVRDLGVKMPNQPLQTDFRRLAAPAAERQSR